MSGNTLTGRAAALARRQAQVVGKAALTGQKNTTVVSEKSVSTAVSTPVSQAVSAPRRAVVANSSSAREASRARRAAAAAKGKQALRTTDRQRSDVIRQEPKANSAKKDCSCGCDGAKETGVSQSAAPSMNLSASVPAASKRFEKVNMPNSTGRLNARARRQAMSAKGKKGLDVHRKGLSSVEVMRQQNPEISSREIARNKRAMCSSVGARAVSTTTTQSGRQRPNRKNPATTGTKVANSEKTTGGEAGLCRSVTGTEYFSSDVFETFCKDKPLVYPQKVQKTETLSGMTVTTGGKVGRSAAVTGDERGSCKSVTGTEYVGREDFDDFCKTKPEPGSAKVSFSQTSRGLVVSGSKPARATGVTGNEAGTCKAVTGTPYAGVEQFEEFCDASAVERVARKNSVMPEVKQPVSGVQPGVTGLTGADRGACKNVSGTGYINQLEQQAVCEAAPAQPNDSDFPQVMSAMTAFVPASTGAVTGAYSEQGRISGTFSMGQGKVTGTEEFRFGGRDANVITAAPKVLPEQAAAVNRVTGEGMSVGMKITGNDWDRGDRVTGTEGTSAIKRNMTRRGPISAMTPPQNKRNEDIAPSDTTVTGSSGSTQKGAMVTVSGGARG